MMHDHQPCGSCLNREQPDLVRAFLFATAKGYSYAAAHPEDAAAVLCAEVSADTAATVPLPEPLDADMVKESQV